MKINLKFSIGIIVILILGVVFWYINIKPSVNEMDIMVEGFLELNNTGINDYKKYLLNIKMTKNKDCHIAVYPYISGLGQMSFSDEDKNDYYVPGSIGSDGVTETIAIQALKNNNMIENGSDTSLIGFWFPDGTGKYESRIYLDQLDMSNEIKDPVFILVYHENKFGKQLTWSKIVPIKNN